MSKSVSQTLIRYRGLSDSI